MAFAKTRKGRPGKHFIVANESAIHRQEGFRLVAGTHRNAACACAEDCRERRESFPALAVMQLAGPPQLHRPYGFSSSLAITAAGVVRLTVLSRIAVLLPAAEGRSDEELTIGSMRKEKRPPHPFAAGATLKAFLAVADRHFRTFVLLFNQSAAVEQLATFWPQGGELDVLEVPQRYFLPWAPDRAGRGPGTK